MDGAMQAIGIESILLVDDDDTVRTVLCEQLRELGISVDAVADGESAIRMLGNPDVNYDLLLTDYAMPGKNGIETIEGARAKRPKLRALLMTGYADDAAIAEIKQTVPVLRKPIDVRELTRLLA
jgi:CheY-like chemotaxis protein